MKHCLKKNKKKLSKLQRDLARKKKFSCNWKKAKSKISKLQNQIANKRKDFLHKTTTEIAKNHGTVVMEKLKTRNMTRTAKGTIENPIRNVKAKAGLNRAILGIRGGICLPRSLSISFKNAEESLCM